MRAAVCRESGPPEVVRVEEFPPPALGPGQVRVGVRAAAVNYPDVLLVAGEYQVKLPVPFVPGSEFAGVVTEVAGDVVRPRRGERVFGTTMAGSFGTEIVVSAEAVRVVPTGLDDRVAAAFGVAHRTAYHVLRSVACLQAGEELVVLGAGGGVGLAGGDLAEPALRALRWAGRFVTVGYASGVIPRIPLNLVLLKGIRILGFQLRDLAAHRPDEVRRNEEELIGLLAGGYVTPRIGAVFALEQAAAALRYVADGRAVGKVVLDVSAAVPQWPDRAGTTAST